MFRLLGLMLAVSCGVASAQTTYRLTDFGPYSDVTAINSAGQVTGQVAGHAFLWDGTTVRDLGTLGGSSSYGFAINAAGQVTGYSRYEIANTNWRAFLFDGTTMKDLGTLGGSRSVGTAINASGQVTGWSYVEGGGLATRHAFLWDGTEMKDLGTLGGALSIPVAINATGQVTGYSTYSSGGEYYAFVSNGTTMQPLTLGGAWSWGTAINDAGQVTGTSTADPGTQYAFLWDGSTMKSLGTLGGCCSIGRAINATGQVTGSSNTPSWYAHAFLWDSTSMMDLGTLGGFFSAGQSINASSQVTGYSYRAGETFGQERAFVWDGTAMRDLNDLIDPATPLPSNITLQYGVAINDQGQIIATGCDNTNPLMPVCHGFLLSPISPARMISTLLQSVTGVGAGRSLVDKMTLVQTYYAAQDMTATCASLSDFVSQVKALSRAKKIESSLAAKLISDAQAIMAAIGCG